jgi:polysaccharide biosynthesis transport protein
MQDYGSELPSVATSSRELADPSQAAARLEPLAVPLTRFGGIIRRHYLVIMLTLLLGVGGTTAIVSMLPKQFTAEATLLIEPRRTQVSDLQAISADPGDVVSLIRTQMDILNSPTLLMNVVKALDLQDNKSFMQPGGVTALLSGYVHQLIAFKSPPPLPLTDTQRTELAAGILAGKIGFANEMRSSVLRMQVTTDSPTLSANVANEIARQFLSFKRQEKFSAMQRAGDWFQAQLAGLADQVHTAESAVEQYRAEHGLIDSADEGADGGALRPTSVLRQQLDQVASQLTQASRDLSQKEAKLAQAKIAVANNDLGSLPDVLVSPMITELMAQETAISAQAARLAASEGSSNPEMIATRAQLHRVAGRLAVQMANVVQSLSSEVQSAREQQETLQHRLEDLRQKVGQENAAEVGLRGLQAKAHATRSLYDSFLTRATELANVAGIQEPDASLVSSATPPLGPSAPQRTRFIAVSLLLSMVLGIALACLIERVRSGFGSPEQLEASLGIRSFGLVPAVPAKSRLPMARGQAARRFAASLDNIRGHLHAMGEGRPKVVMISSALPQEGKSVLAAGIATNAARAGWRVLLLECDFRRPFMAKNFGLSASPGLSDILAGGLLGSTASPLHEVRPRLFVLPGGSVPADPQELLASHRMALLLAELRGQYDLVILDTPPVIPVADALVLSRHADATLLVVRWEKTSRVAVHDALSLLRRGRASLMATVLTRADVRRAAQSGGRPAKLYDYGSDYRIGRS